MVDVDQALDWLDVESGTRLSPGTQNLINSFATGTNPNQRRNIILTLLRMATNMPDPFEQAEVFAHCGVFFYRLMEMGEAIRWLQQANDYYQYLEDKHRQACTSWMLYRVMRAAGHYPRAFDYGRRARGLLIEKAFQYHQMEQAGTESWYLGRAQDLTVDLISMPEDSFEWLFEFNSTRMTLPAMQIKDRAQDHIERRLFDEADRDLEMLLEITSRSRECIETAEAMAFCGVAEWVMEHQMNALYYFRSALTQYVPSPHEYAIVTWMMGLAEWSFPDLRSRSISTMETAIHKTDELRQAAVWQNETVKRDWYEMHFAAMRRVLTHLIG